MYQLRIAIVGGGVGGLGAAIALRRAGFDAHVYERAPAIRPVGWGLCLWPNGAKAANLLGLEPVIEARSPELRAVEFRSRDDEPLSQIDLQSLVTTTGQRPYPLARADLLAALLDRLGNEHVTLGAQCVSVSQGGGHATAAFKDGATIAADIVVGADGLNSAVRGHVVLGSKVRSLSWDCEGLIETPPHIAESRVFRFWVGDGKRAAILPVTPTESYIFFDFAQPPPTPGEGMQEHLRELFAGWCQPVQELVEAVLPARASNIQHRDLEAMPTFTRGRVVLLGDAAHAMTPFLGQGAAIALEDGLVLAHFLQSTSVSIEDALDRYQRERMQRSLRIVEGARAKGEQAVSDGTEANRRYYDELRRGSRDFVESVEKITLSGPLR